MRHIKRNRFVPSTDWLEKARKASEDVKALEPEQRAKVIDKNSKIWKELKTSLSALSHGKCWYCESRETPTSPGDVDHFRPKSDVKDCPSHPGYWWKAFDWKNLYYGCENCNRLNTDPVTGITGGKGSAFPLWDERQRVFNESNPGGLVCEEPMLLDPTVATDVSLLTFDPDGMARPARNELRCPKEYQRAEQSIRIYHLNRVSLKEARQFDVCNRVTQLVDDGKMYLELAALGEGVSARQGYVKVVEALSEMIDERAQYSAAARAVLKVYRDLEWVDDLLTA